MRRSDGRGGLDTASLTRHEFGGGARKGGARPLAAHSKRSSDVSIDQTLRTLDMDNSYTPTIPLSSPTAIGWTRAAQQYGGKHDANGVGLSVRSPPLHAKATPKIADTVDWALSPIVMSRQRSLPHSDSPSMQLAPRLAGGTPDPRRALTVSAFSPRGPAIALLNASADMHSPNTSPTTSPPGMSPPTTSPSIDSSWSAQSSVASAGAFSFQHHSVGSGDGLWLSPSPSVLPEASPRSALIARESLQEDSSSLELPYVSASCPVTPTYHHPAAAADSSAHHARAESQQHRHLPPCHPYMPSAMEIAAFASLGNSSMPSASPTNLSQRGEMFAEESITMMDPHAPLTNGKESHGPQGAGVECCGRGVVFQLPQSGISGAHRIIYTVSIALLLATVAVITYGRSFLASLPAHCDIILSWTLSCNLAVLSAMQVGQLGANFNVVSSLGVVHSWPAHVLKQGRLGFVGAAMVYYTGLLLYLAEGHKVITTRRLTLEGGIGVGMAPAKGTEPLSELPTMSLLFPSAAQVDHTGCGLDDRFDVFYLSTLLLNLALWLFFFSLLVHLLSAHHRDSPASRSTQSNTAAAAANAQKCSQCNGPVNTSKWGVNPGRILSWMRGRSSNLCPTCAYKHAAASSASVSPVNAPFVSGEVVWYVAPTPLQPVAPLLPSSLSGRRGSSDRWFQRWLKNSWLDKLGALPGDRNQGRLANTFAESGEGRHRRSPSNPDLAAGVPLLSLNTDRSSLVDVAPGRRSSSDGSPSPPAPLPLMSPSSLSTSGAFEVIFRRYVDRSPQHASGGGGSSGGAAEGDCFVCLLHDLTSVMRTNVMHLRRAKDMHPTTGAHRGFAPNAGSRVQKHLV